MSVVPARTDAAAPLRVAIVAGEHSGDTLGAALIEALRARVPNLECFGVAGPKMVAAGCEAWAPADSIAVMGLAEVVRHLPRLLRLRSSLRRRFLAARPDVFIGIDSPEFNLGLAGRLKRAGIRTVQYVSPQVWAWRQGRVRTIGRDCDLVLCLLPFESAFYASHAVRAEFVGHPLADQIPLEADTAGARAALGIATDARVVALLPGSRMFEVAHLAAPFIEAVNWLHARRPDLEFIAPMASAALRERFERELAQGTENAKIRLIDGQAQRVLAAADAVLVASGTATLETLLSGKPMVVAYKVSWLTYFLVRTLGLVKIPFFSQPNLLAGRSLVPEFEQAAVNGAAMGAALLAQLDDPAHAAVLRAEFTRIHQQLRRGGATRAASAVLECLGRG
jgi:lipid-A-disaccharide synthase